MCLQIFYDGCMTENRDPLPSPPTELSSATTLLPPLILLP